MKKPVVMVIDNDRMTDIFLKYQKAIERFITGLIQDRETARDLTQETFIKFARYEHEDSEVKPHLYRIAKTLVIDWLRSQKRSRVEFVCDNVVLESDRGDRDTRKNKRRIEAIAKNNEKARDDLEWAHYFMNQLDYNTRTALNLVAEGRSYEEIGGMLNKQKSTIKNLIYEGRQKLRMAFNAARS